ncbi:hypothetical protein [Burkholderia ubonensis]|uniref:hypothetical protein n=1 Tax=Burkholderia ubonensis TaxID=101571 RepID=UPI000AF22337|nr:hypothetical protein [Burkholderia ubonensis]
MAFAISGTSRAQSGLKFRVRIHSIVESHARQRYKQNSTDQGQEKRAAAAAHVHIPGNHERAIDCATAA